MPRRKKRHSIPRGRHLFFQVLDITFKLSILVISIGLVYLGNCYGTDKCPDGGVIGWLSNLMQNPADRGQLIGFILVVIAILHFAHDSIEIIKSVWERIRQLFASQIPFLEFDEDTLPIVNNHQVGHLYGYKYYFMEELEKHGHQTFIPMNYICLQKNTPPQSAFSTSIMKNFRYYGKRLAIIGTPGSGKSRVLQAIYLNLMDRYKSGDPLPLWIDLKESSNPRDARQLFIKYCNRIELNMDFDGMMVNNPPIVFLDGLDEIPVQFRYKLVRSLERWFKTHPRMKVVISCRVRDYKDDSYVQKFCNHLTVLELKPFGTSQIKQYLREHIKAPQFHTLKKLDKELAARLYEMIINDRDIRELAQTPLHLYMLTQLSIWKDTVDALPKTLSDLYADYYKQVFYHVRKYRHLHHDDPDELRKKIAGLAALMLDPELKGEHGVSRLTKETIIKEIGDDGLKDAENLNLLVAVQGNSSQIQFFHPMIHTYFALPEIERIIANESRKGTMYQNLVRLFHKKDKEITDLIREIGDLGPLAGRAAAETLTQNLSRSGNSEKMQNVTVNALKNIGIEGIRPILLLLLEESEQTRIYAQDILIHMGEPIVGAMIIFAEKNNNNKTVYKHVEIILDDILKRHKEAKVDSDFALISIVDAVKRRGKSKEARDEFRVYAAEYLGTVSSTDAMRALESMIEELIEMLNDNDNYELRAEAARALGKLGSGEKDHAITNALLKRLKYEEVSFAQSGIITAIQERGENAISTFLLTFRQLSGRALNNFNAAYIIMDKDSRRRKKVLAAVTLTPLDSDYLKTAVDYYAKKYRKTVETKRVHVNKSG